MPATSQLERLISMTAISVPSGWRGVRHRLRSFNFCMGRSIGSHQRRWIQYPRRRPIASLLAGLAPAGMAALLAGLSPALLAGLAPAGMAALLAGLSPAGMAASLAARSFATEPSRAKIYRCPLCAESEHSRHESE